MLWGKVWNSTKLPKSFIQINNLYIQVYAQVKMLNNPTIATLNIIIILKPNHQTKGNIRVGRRKGNPNPLLVLQGSRVKRTLFLSPLNLSPRTIVPAFALNPRGRVGFKENLKSHFRRATHESALFRVIVKVSIGEQATEQGLLKRAYLFHYSVYKIYVWCCIVLGPAVGNTGCVTWVRD